MNTRHKFIFSAALCCGFLSGCRYPGMPLNSERNSCDIFGESAYLSALSSLRNIPGTFYYTPKNLLEYYSRHTNQSAAFLQTLCDESKDNQGLLSAKLALISRIHRVKEGELQRFDANKPLWPQLTAEGFRELVLISRSLSKLRKSNRTANAGSTPINGCEFKFIFENYLAPHRSVLDSHDVQVYQDSLAKYLQAADGKENCSTEELNSFYAFRGMGAITPLSPVSVSGSQAGSALSVKCRRHDRERMTPELINACYDYARAPDAARRSIVMQIVRRLVRLSRENDPAVQDPKIPLALTEDLNGDGIGEAVVASKDSVQNFSQFDSVMTKYYLDYVLSKSKNQTKDLLSSEKKAISLLKSVVSGERGLGASYIDSQYKLNTEDYRGEEFANGNREIIGRALTTLINRHTYYYFTLLYLHRFEEIFRPTTPFMSSSVDISQAFKFIFKGYAQSARKTTSGSWMYVFKIKSSNRYAKQDLLKGRSLNLNSDWIDEASFSSHPFAAEEKGLDRFNGPAPEELDTLLFLGDVKFPPELLIFLSTESSKQAGDFEGE